jgi:hypothetical protein
MNGWTDGWMDREKDREMREAQVTTGPTTSVYVEKGEGGHR